MNVIGMIAVILFSLGLLVLCVIGFILRAIFSRQETSPLEDETRLVQDMFRTLNRLEERITVLETLLHERRTPPAGR